MKCTVDIGATQYSVVYSYQPREQKALDYPGCQEELSIDVCDPEPSVRDLLIIEDTLLGNIHEMKELNRAWRSAYETDSY